jgi:hypothetical protein
MRFAPTAAAALAILLAACQSQPEEPAEPRFKTPDKGAYSAQPAEAPAAAAQGAPLTPEVTVQEDLFNDRTNYYTNSVTVPESDGQTSWRLAGQKAGDGGKPNYRLRVIATYKSSHWHYYRNANDERLAPLEVVLVDRRTAQCNLTGRDCTYSETFDILLTDPQIRDGLARGLALTVSPSTARNLTITVPPQYVRGLLEKMT